jgi:hypothetical protein
VNKGDKFPLEVTTEAGKSPVARLPQVGAAEALPVPVCTMNFLVVVVFPASRVAAPLVLPYIMSPTAVMGLEKPEAAAIVICPAEGVIVMFAPATIDFHSSPEPLLTTPNI